MGDERDTRSLPVGVFDSGIGGLTVLRQLRQALPRESFVYLGDTARVPYGNRSEHTVVRYARMACSFLTGRGIKVLVVACNTVSAVALDMLRVEFDIPVLGVIDPPARAACRLRPAGRIGVLGTRRTVSSGAYDRAVKRADSRCEVSSSPAPLFVPLAEEGWLEGEVPSLVARQYLAPLVERSVDALVLGCTHYPLLIPVLESSLASLATKEVPIIDSAGSVASEASAFLVQRGLGRPAGGHSDLRFYVTDNPESFTRVGRRFLGDDLDPRAVELVDL
ncbi:MAG: glutamate racemase [Deltaproteobacteria bacterium]|nr:glutamate racemase [Deltaproteobacteria bacterium]